jgi:hypothetical protein
VTINKSANYINHIALVLDASLSMYHRESQLVTVADSQIEYLAQRSKELDQETRITVYTFSDNVECVIYDKDVLRLPSISKLYEIGGNTALIDATLLSQTDLAMTPEKYGDHAFLTYVLTDGQENRSKASQFDLAHKLALLPDHWTVAVLVPDMRGKHDAKKCGFPTDNIAIWDTTSPEGINEVGRAIRQATDTFMENRSVGIRGSRTLFSTGVEAVNKVTIKEAKLKPIPKNSYTTLDVYDAAPIRDYVQKSGYTFIIGKVFYQLTKTESIQPQKNIALRNKKTGTFYSGPQSRDILGLPFGVEVRVKPDYNPDYDVFVQSTSVNRRLVPGTKLLVLS